MSASAPFMSGAAGPLIELSAYALQRLQRDQRFVLYRGLRAPGPETGPARVLVQEPAQATAETRDYLQHSLALREELEPAWAASPIALAAREGRAVLVLEDPGGDPLDGLLESRRGVGMARELGLFLRLAIGIAAAVGKVHARGLVHKDINPANVLANLATARVWLTGFGIASRCPQERQPPEVIAGTLPYISPEQTGRLNRSIDSRSDLYSLGVTLYEMLTGTLPFAANDPIEWVHSHVARLPSPPSERLAGTEGARGAVSGIVIKLLAKDPRDRYQTARGLQIDLERCLAQWEAEGRIDDFALGEHDAPDQLTLTGKLYGRERDLATLLSSFERVAESGTPELLLVGGHAGVGKSSLVHELEKAIAARPATFASGKFEQSKRRIPYLPFAQAFRTLILTLLAKTETELAVLRECLREAVGSNGRIVADLVPEIEFVIGPQPPLVALSPQEEKQRVHIVLRRFLGVFAQPERPLVLFLDDLQWADAASLDAVQDLLTNPDLRHFLVIATYRDNEVDDAHPMHAAREAIRTAGSAVRSVTIEPLGPHDLTRWTADLLREAVEDAAALARVVHEKTAGNPFFAVQFVSALVEQGLLRFDHDAGRWSVDLDRVVAQGHTDNLVDILVARFGRLPPETLAALQQMACLGNMASRWTLATVLGKREEEVDTVLSHAVRLELIRRDGEGTYRFLHDRLQEAAYSLLPEGLRADAHLRIGSLLDAHMPADKQEATIFEVVNQLNRGAALIHDVQQRERLAEKNLLAAKRAKTSTAHASALEYAAAGLSSLPEDAGERRRELRFELELLCAECEVFTGAHTAAAERLAGLSTRAASSMERASVACRQADLYFALGQPGRAIDVCLDYLQQVGFQWPRHPTEEDVRREYEAIWSRLREQRIEDLLELPLMTDPATLGTMNVLATVGQSMFFAEPDLYVLTECLAVRLSMEHGNTDGSTDAYLRLGLISAQRFGDYRGGFRLGKVGYDLVERRGLKRFLASTYTGFTSGLMPLGAPARVVRDLIPRVYNLIADEFGDRLQATWYGPQVVDKLLAAGNPLAEVQREAEDALKTMSNAPVSVGTAMDIATSQLAFVRTLRGLTDAFGSFDADDFDERRFERHLSENPSLVFVAGWYWVLKLTARFFARDLAAALEASSNASRALQSSVPMLFYAADHHLFGALAHAASFESAAADARKEHALEVARHHRQLQAWAENCPENFEYRAALVAAEIARIEGRDLEAQHLYEQALRAARENGFVHGEALSYEIAARFYAARGFDTFAKAYMSQARDAYLRWGADGKVRQLDDLHPPRDADVLGATARGTFTAPIEHLDLATVVKVSEAVSSELDPERLIEGLMRSALELAGADRGVLLLVQSGELRVQAEATTTGSDAVSLRLPDASSEPIGVPEAITAFVARTHERVSIADAAAAHPFAGDLYLENAHPRSVLCLPLTKQGTLVGALYLENALTPHAFAPRATALTVLASAAAMALDNSRLYRELAQREAKIRRLIDANLIGVVVTDGNTKVVEANDAFFEMLGYTRDSMPNWYALTPPEWIAASDQLLANLKAGRPGTLYKEYWRRDGTRVPVLVAVAPIPELGQAIAFVLDLSDRKKAEEERERATRAEAEQRTAVADERNRLASEIHDSLAQGLAMMVMQLADAEAKLGPARSAAERQLSIVRELAVQSLSYARRSVSVLRPGVVPGGLPRVVRDIVDSIRRHFAGSVKLTIEGDVLPLDAAVESGLASLAREALTNATRHSGAALIDVELAYSRPGTVRLVVKDSGVGFDASAVRPDAYGLISMQERAARVGVALTIITEPGAGTEVVASYTSSSTPLPATS